MKKVVSVLLVLTMLLAFGACGGAESTTDTSANEAAYDGLRVGFARENITPDYSVPLGGYGNSSTRMSLGFYDYIYTSAIALNIGDDTVIIIENDLQAQVKRVLDEVRQKVSEQTGVPVERVMAGVNHVHSAPDLWNTAEPSIEKYTTWLIEKMVNTAVMAWKDMKPATVTSGDTQVENVNFVRHYTLADGHVRGPNFGLQYNSEKIGHTHEPDKTMQVVKFAQEGGEEIAMINWQSHPQNATSSTDLNITSDTIGAMRSYVEEQTGCKVFYVLGASGDVMSVSLIESDNVYKDYKQLGQALGKAAQSVLQGDMTALDASQISSVKKVYTGIVDKTEEHKVDAARKIYEQWTLDNNYEAAVEAGKPYDINSPYHAKGILNRHNMEDTGDLELYAIAIGDLGMVFAPYEMFCENGAYIKEHSPYATTVVCTMANDNFNYIAAEAGFDYNCYEANTCRFVRGTAEALAEEYVSMLNQLKGK